MLNFTTVPVHELGWYLEGLSSVNRCQVHVVECKIQSHNIMSRQMRKRSKINVLQNHKLWSNRFFSVKFDGEGSRSKFEQEDGQTDREIMARASICDVGGAT